MIVQNWNRCQEELESQVQKFNQTIQKSKFSEKEFDEIYEIVKREVERLQELTDAATDRENALTHKGCCSHSGKALWIIGGINFFSKACVIGGGALAIISDTPPTKWIGLAIASVAEILDAITVIYETKISLQEQEIRSLAKLNRQGFEHARIFKKFLKKLREINEENKNFIEKQNEKLLLKNQNVINKISSQNDLDTEISQCLGAYENLPLSYQNDKVYSRIISLLIQKLPSNDLLRIELAKLEPPNKEIPVNQFPSVSYLPSSKKKERKGSLDEEKESKWVLEEHSKMKEDFTDSDKKSNHHEKFANYKRLIAQRFKVKNHIPFVDTPNGWRIDDEQGVIKRPDLENIEQNSDETIIRLSENEKNTQIILVEPDNDFL